MKDSNLLHQLQNSFLFIILILFSTSIGARTIEEQISFELDSLKFLEYLDESDSSISKFYKDFSPQKNIRYVDSDSCFCTDTLKMAIKNSYKPYGWIVTGAVSASILNIVGGAAALVANEKMSFSNSDDSLLQLEKRCSSTAVNFEQSKIRFKYTTYGVIVGVIINSLIVYNNLKD